MTPDIVPLQTGTPCASCHAVLRRPLPFCPRCGTALTAEAAETEQPRVSVVIKSERWERTRLSEALGARLRQLLDGHHIDELNEVVDSIDALASSSGDPEAGIDARTALFDAAAEHYELLLDWLRRPSTRALAMALLKGLGRNHLDFMVESLGEIEREHVNGLYEVISSLEAPRELIDRISRLEPEVMRRCLRACSALSDPAFEPLLCAALLTGVHEVRLSMLQCLNEARAFRFLNLVRARLHDPDARVRGAAVRWVARLEDQRSVRELEALLERSDIAQGERLDLYRALERIGGPRALELLRLGSQDTASAEVRSACRRALISLHV